MTYCRRGKPNVYAGSLSTQAKLFSPNIISRGGINLYSPRFVVCWSEVKRDVARTGSKPRLME